MMAVKEETIIRTFFEEQKKYINHFFDALDFEKTEEILEKFLQCQGSLIFTGVGKSGIIAQKLAQTFLSFGTKAFFLPPMDALHGDLGILTEQDLFIVLSKSGETEEVLKLLPHVRKKKAKVIAIVSSAGSQLAKKSDVWISLPLLRELCPFNLAPTTSTTLQLIFGDVLATAMMRKKNFTLQDYALNHPAGLIGKKITLRVEDLMLKGKDVPLCKPSDQLIDVLPRLSEKRCGMLLVVDEAGKLLGIFTDGDLRRALESQGGKILEKPVAELMNASPRWTHKDILAVDALKQMEENPKSRIMALAVLERGKVIGLLHIHDILQAGLR